MTAGAPQPGDRIAPFVVAAVDAQRMKTMAAILRDPYPIHWDRRSTAALGFEGRTVNQGPLNLAYIANMLMSWAGDDSIRRLTVCFHGRVLDGDSVEAHGVVDEVASTSTGWVATCSVWLQRGEDRIVSGTAIIERISLPVSGFQTTRAGAHHGGLRPMKWVSWKWLAVAPTIWRRAIRK